ncbi:FkbM family methyltransferase [Rhodovulum sulfidophilum]|uniref:FkbM family methyltransferase n=1 Tax=Rhodovulum sulfidophilum TaxID=35806 RepID=UPI001922DCE9|nr:FkbM family methyltransferase [Rhodovulum sulfidophilum]MBL3576175.1 FkbM family methyltransferase [Rhodovulum sulfidophilum]MCE8433820.1 FkbM family methyltransferase [Rhodovulum sulfidophilum]MCF4119157.1 FkbM family methyltransferase [Rhodovulum sulfidophilum]
MTMTNLALDTCYGAIHVPGWPGDLIVRSLNQLGEWCICETILAAALLRPNETLWDAGAYLGTFSLGVSLLTRPARVVAIEANPDLTALLAKNLALLPCPAELVASGLAGRPGWLVPFSEDPNNHGATAYLQSDAQPADHPQIPCQTLPALRALHDDYDFLKLDLEGMELDALRADFTHIRDRRPVIWAECNESPASLQLLGAMKWLGYDVLYLAFPAFRSANYRGSRDLIYPMAYEAALVAGPTDRLEALSKTAPALVPGEDILCRHVQTSYDLRRALFDTPRWARKDWTEMSRAELIARLGRTEMQTPLGAFLK